MASAEPAIGHSTCARFGIGAFLVGGELSVEDVIPNAGRLRQETAVLIKGTGFDPIRGDQFARPPSSISRFPALLIVTGSY